MRQRTRRPFPCAPRSGVAALEGIAVLPQPWETVAHPGDMPTIDEITDELRDVTLQVHNAQERREERDLVTAAQEGVERLSRHYREMYAALGPGDQMKVDR